MSTKATIFLTGDNEHCYFETNEPVKKKDGTHDFAIVMEFDKRHISIIQNNEEDLIITLKDPDSELYKLIAGLRQ